MKARRVADIDLALRLFEGLRRMSSAEPGVTRAAYGEGEDEANRIVRAEAEAIGLTASGDAAANLYLRCDGQDAGLSPWIVGSHLDSVPHGGNFDGAAGVIAGLAVLSGLKKAGLVPPRPVVIMAIRAEESTWFPASYIGSRAAFGLLEAAALDLARADSGRTLAAHMAESGGRPDEVRRGTRQLDPTAIHAFIELHIEQGPTLDIEEVPVGIVTGIAGSFRYRRAVCHGVYGHSGAVPRRHRRDAAMAFADLAMRLDRAWAEIDREGRGATVTFGEVSTDASLHAFSKVPGTLDFCLDVRSEDAAVLARLHEALLDAVAAIGAERGVTIGLGQRSGSTPALMDAGLRERLERLAADAAIATRTMPSGAGHDAATFANAGVPAAMLFIRNQNGSHNPAEAMRIEDFAAAADLLAGLVMEAR